MFFENLNTSRKVIIMTKNDLQWIKDYLKNDFLLNDYLHIQLLNKERLKVFYSDLIITISEMGFAYLVSWWADGTITGGKANNITRLCRQYNERF